VTPASLLFPRDVEWDDIVELTPEVRHRAYDTWRWAQSLAPLPPELGATGSSEREDATPSDRASDFAKNALPRGGDVKFDPALRANYDLGGRISISLRDFGNPANWDRRRSSLIRSYRMVGLMLEELIAREDREAAAKTADVIRFDTAAAQRQLQDAESLGDASPGHIRAAEASAEDGEE